MKNYIINKTSPMIYYYFLFVKIQDGRHDIDVFHRNFELTTIKVPHNFSFETNRSLLEMCKGYGVYGNVLLLLHLNHTPGVGVVCQKQFLYMWPF